MGAPTSRIGVSVVGYGYWGPNMVRNIVESHDFDLVSVCERDENRIAGFQHGHPTTCVDRELDTVLSNPRVEAVAIATPPATHYSLVRRSLDAGKHVLVEKPLATSSGHAAELIALADRTGLVLMPGHTFLYSPSVNKVSELVREDALGEIFFVTSSRMNLGRYQQDGVVWDLAPHDLSILSWWLGEPLVEVSAKGRSIFQDGVPETAFLNLIFASGIAANVQISWLAPSKVRQMVVVGSRRMVQYEDTSAEESVRIYDRGFEFEEPPSNFGEYRLTYRAGDMVAPRIEPAEPLGLELRDFAQSIRDGSEPRSNAALGLEIVLALEALEQSLNSHGELVAVQSASELLGASVPLTFGNGHLAGLTEAGSNGHLGNGNGNGSAAAGNGSGRRRFKSRNQEEVQLEDPQPAPPELPGRAHVPG
jgi:predicted dehydrogenase